ncbi:MAG: hypothetical protein U1C18_01060, partial [Patescibacteria group bacterium]|nr:hypothetical protein [Patescibacteria group bacterium]
MGDAALFVFGCVILMWWSTKRLPKNCFHIDAAPFLCYTIFTMEAINQEFNQPVTRGEFREFTDSIGEVITDIVEKGNKKTVDTVLTAMDAVAKEVKTMREEQAG